MRHKSMRKSIIISLFLLLMSLLSYPLLKADYGSSYYWLKPGVYATYVLLESDFPNIPGLMGSIHVTNNVLALTNGTTLLFDNLILTWRVLSIRGDIVSVEYRLKLINVTRSFPETYGTKPTYLGDLEFYDVFQVNASSLEAFDEEERYVGTWPFWVHLYYLNNNITIIHGLCKLKGEKIFHEDVVVRLVDLAEIGSVFNVKGNPGIKTYTGFFSFKRILAFQPCFRPGASGDTGVTINYTAPYYVSTGIFNALYDKVSLIMIGYEGCYVDDIILHILGNNTIIYKINIKGLILNSTNIDFKFGRVEEESTNINLKLILCIVLGVALAGGVVYVWRKRVA